MNERKTEDIVEQRLRANEYYGKDSLVVVEKQKSDLPRIQKLLENASKRGQGVGKPEFLIRSSLHSDFIVVIECKANPQKHASPTLDRYADYAVDGVLLYASYLAREFDVLAIAVSGEGEASLRISHYFYLRGAPRAIGYPQARDIVSFEEYHEAFIHSDAKFRQDYSTLLDYGRSLNNLLQAKKVTEAERGFLISGILIALQNKAFMQSFRVQGTARQLAANPLGTIRGEFENAYLPQDRTEDLVQAFSFISHSPAIAYLGSYGDIADLTSIESMYAACSSDFEKADCVMALSMLESGRRNAFYSSIKGDGLLVDRAIKMVKARRNS